MFEIIKTGGWMMLPIILCSIVALAISIERYWSLKPEKIVPKNLFAQVCVWIQHNQIDANRLRELRQGSPLGSLFAAGLGAARLGRDVMRENIEDAAREVVHDLERYIEVLGTIAGVAPLIGLLGTVMGIIKVFAAMMSTGHADMSALAGGISEVLIATAAGLCVAIPALVMYRFYLRRVDYLVVALERECGKLVEVFHGQRAPAREVQG